MRTSDLRQRLSTSLIDFGWDEWTQMGVLGAPRRQSRWAQDPEALLLFTLEVGRDEPRLFDEVLDWLFRNEPIVSIRRLRTLCQDLEDERLANAAVAWVANHRRKQSPPEPLSPRNEDLVPLFRGLSTPSSRPDPAFAAHGFVRPEAHPSGKSREPDLAAPISFAFRLRHLLGVSVRAEAVRYLLTVDAPRVSVAAVASSAGYAKRNVYEALASLDAAGAISLVTLGSDQRFGIDRSRWAHLLDIDAEELPVHRDWPELLYVLRRILRWLDRPELAQLSDYLRASQSRDLLEEIRPALAHAGVVTPAWRGGEASWDDLANVVDYALMALGPRSPSTGPPATFEIYADASGGHRWRLYAANGRIVATSIEAYTSRSNALAAVERLRKNADAYDFLVDGDEAGNYRWRATASNGQTVATASESYAARHSAERAARHVRELVPAAAGP